MVFVHETGRAILITPVSLEPESKEAPIGLAT